MGGQHFRPEQFEITEDRDTQLLIQKEMVHFSLQTSAWRMMMLVKGYNHMEIKVKECQCRMERCVCVCVWEVGGQCT